MKNSSPNLKILLVDDDVEFCTFLSDLIFDRIGIRPKTAHNGEHAKTIITSEIPDILITDTNMPKLNGIELIKYARAHFPHIEIFSLFEGLAGSNMTIHDVKAMGVNLVLSKVDVSHLLLPALEAINTGQKLYHALSAVFGRDPRTF